LKEHVLKENKKKKIGTEYIPGGIRTKDGRVVLIIKKNKA